MIAISVLALALAGDPAGKSDQTTTTLVTFPVVRLQLENGLRVLLQEDHSLPLLTLHTFYRVGSRNESSGATGLAHLIEHMMFNGAEKYGPKEFDRIIEALGGYSNAYTDLDLTAYHETLFPDGLDDVLDMEADRISSLKFDPEIFRTESAVVREERRLSSEEDVLGSLSELLWSQAFCAHPYHCPVVGWMSDLENIKPEQARAFFRSYYVPSNCILVLAGDFDATAARGKIAAALGDLERGSVPEKPMTHEPTQRGERRCILRDQAELPALELGWHVPAVTEENNAGFLVLGRLLAGSRTALLEHELAQERGLLTEVSVEYTPTVDPGLFVVVARVTDGTSVAEAEQALRATMARVTRERVSEREVSRARNLAQMDLVHGLATIEGRADLFGTYELWFGDYNAVFRLEQRLAAVDAAALQGILQSFCRDDNLTVATLLPGGSQPASDEEGEGDGGDEGDDDMKGGGR